MANALHKIEHALHLDDVSSSSLASSSSAADHSWRLHSGHGTRSA